MIRRHRTAIPIFRSSALLLGSVFVALLARSASADPMVSYSLDVSENLSVLLDQNNPLVKANASKATPFQLAVARNMPYLLLENTSTVANGGSGTAQLTHFELSISASDQTFDWAKILVANTDPGVSVQLLTPNALEDNIKNQVISMNITGLTPGKKLVFQVDLDPLNSSGSDFADYRHVFFQLDTNNNMNNSMGNATTTATFVDPPLPPVVLPKAVWHNQEYPEQFGEPIMGLKFPSKPQGDHVMWFPTGDFGTQPVPEPSAAILASLSALGLLVFRRLMRRQQGV